MLQPRCAERETTTKHIDSLTAACTTTASLQRHARLNDTRNTTSTLHSLPHATQ